MIGRRTIGLGLALLLVLGGLAAGYRWHRERLNSELRWLLTVRRFPMAGELGQPAQNDGIAPLLRRGADIRTRGEGWNNTVLMFAATWGLEETLRNALAAGLHPDEPDLGGWTALSYAAHNGQGRMLELLLQQGASPDAGPENGETPLRSALNYDFGDDTRKVVELLLEHGADPNLRDTTGETVLISAVDGSGNPVSASVVRLLLEHGADPNLKDEEGKTALDYARENGFTEMVELLRGFGARE